MIIDVAHGYIILLNSCRASGEIKFIDCAIVVFGAEVAQAAGVAGAVFGSAAKGAVKVPAI